MTNIIDQKYMLTHENIIKLLPSVNNVKRDTIKNEIKKHKTNINNNDQLLWIIYKIVEGDYMYETNCNFKTEKDFKIKSIEKLRLIKQKLKTYKLGINRVEDQLLNSKKINMEAFFALSLLYNLNFFYVWNNKYFEFVCSDNSDIYIINNVNDNIIIEDNNSKLEYYKENLFNIENLSKPLKSITSYTKDDLLVIAKKLGIDNIPSKITKKDIYEKILTKM